jgi:hypothetical protein
MKYAYFCSALALENWFDLFAYLPRPRLGQLSSSIGNRRFASILQTFLHKYIRQITLRPIKLSWATNKNVKGHFTKARVNLWHSDRWGTEEFSVANWPMPEKVINFELIQLRFVEFIGNLKIFWRSVGDPSHKEG